MNKKDIAAIKRELKRHNEHLSVTHIYHVYVLKESNEIYYEECKPFELLEEEQQEMFFNNFKKVLTGQLDTKLFELSFQKDVEHCSQTILHRGLLTDDSEQWKEEMQAIVRKMIRDVQYEKDIVVTFIKAELTKGMNRIQDDALDENDFEHFMKQAFILCSINETEQPDKSLQFDYVEKQFKYYVQVDPIINLNKPVAGFLFPCFHDGYANVNHILYAAQKANEPDPYFIEDILNAEMVSTAKEEKFVFEEIVKEVVGEELNSTTLANVYEEINRVIEETEDDVPKLDYKDVERVLKVSGIDDVNSERVEVAFQKVVDDEKYELKATNIVPSFQSKSIKIKTKVANIAISPQDLKYVKQINYSGKRCLLIELDEDAVIEGFTLIPENL